MALSGHSYVPSVNFFGALSDIGDTFAQGRAEARDAELLGLPAQPSFIDKLVGAVSPQPAVAAPVSRETTPMSAPAPQRAAAGGEQADYIRQAALARGIDPETAVRVAASEGLNSYTGDQGSSFGPYQLHYGGVAPGGNRVGGLGDEFTKTTGLDARDPGTWKQQVDFALDQAKRGGWSPFHGAAKVGIGERQGITGGPPVQVADASGRVLVGGMAAPTTDRGVALLKSFPPGLQTPEGIMRAMATGSPHVRAIAEKALDVYLKASGAGVSPQPHVVGPGGTLVGPTGNVLFAAPAREGEATAVVAPGGTLVNKRTGEIITALPPKEEKPTEAQSNAAVFSTRMAKANDILSDPSIYGVALGLKGAALEAVSGVPGVGNLIVSKTEKGPAFQKYDQAKRDFVNAILRKESGAAITPSEFQNAERQYFPRPGDLPEVIAQKDANRKTAIETIASTGAKAFREDFAEKQGGGLKSPPTYDLKRAKEALAAGRTFDEVAAFLKSKGFSAEGLKQ